jgi:1-deoxy-D-xylulose-5-phosphate reductoisomerase
MLGPVSAPPAPGSPRPDRPLGLAVLGSTGSIGTQALDVARANPDRYRVVALAAGRASDALAAQGAEWGLGPDRVRACASDPGALAELAVLDDVDVVVNGVVGFAGLPATIAALEAGKRLALANKESLIAAGPVVRAARERGGGAIVPVDSEHSALHQALRAGSLAEVRRLVVTGSGGPFRGRTLAELAEVTVAEALRHPTWSMGPKITIDSSTLMNKGLEVIEAHELFGIDLERIEVVIHPQSVVHGMVEFCDGSTIAQLSMPDMRLPIAVALADPARLPQATGVVDWTTIGALTFEVPDVDTFRCLPLAYEAARRGGVAPAVLNAANEVAVEAFLTDRVGWPAIAAVVEDALTAHPGGPADTLDAVLEADREGRAHAQAALAPWADRHSARGPGLAAVGAPAPIPPAGGRDA